MIRHHEGRVEADPELTDQSDAVTGFGGLGLLDESLGARPGDRPQRVDHLVMAHADAVVLDRQLLPFRIDGYGNPRPGVVRQQCGIADRFIAQPLAGVRRIRNQLPQEHVLIGINRVHHHLEQLGDIRFKHPAFGRAILVDCRSHIRLPLIILAQEISVVVQKFASLSRQVRHVTFGFGTLAPTIEKMRRACQRGGHTLPTPQSARQTGRVVNS